MRNSKQVVSVTGTQKPGRAFIDDMLSLSEPYLGSALSSSDWEESFTTMGEDVPPRTVAETSGQRAAAKVSACFRGKNFSMARA